MALLIAASLLPLQAQAAKKKSGQDSPAASTVAAQSPVEFADAFHEAMHARDRAKVISMMAPDLVAFETGYLEATRDEYVKSNLDDDIAFAAATDYRPLSRGVIGSGEHMTVLTKASIKGLFGDQRVDLVQSETMILRRTQSGWEIAHLHWSAHPRPSSNPEPRAETAPPARSFEPGPPAWLKESTELTLPVVPEAKPEQAKTP